MKPGMVVRVDAEAPLLPAPGDELAIVDLEAEPEALLHLALPLEGDRGRTDR